MADAAFDLHADNFELRIGSEDTRKCPKGFRDGAELRASFAPDCNDEFVHLSANRRADSNGILKLISLGIHEAEENSAEASRHLLLASSNALPLRNFQFREIFPLIRLQEKYSPMNDDRCFGNAGFEQLGELLRNYRPAEIVALRFVTLVSLKKFQFFQRFHTLRDDFQA